MTSLKRSRNARWQARSFSPQPDRCGGIASSSISFSEHEMIRTQGLPKRLTAGNRITLSMQTTSGSIRARTSGRSFSAHFALSTIASQHSLT